MIGVDNPQEIKHCEPSVKIGGQIGFKQYDESSPLKPTVDRWRALLKGDDWGFPCLKDPDFVEDFISHIPDTGEQDKFVINTSSYRAGLTKDQFDPNYVLVFRRTLPSDQPKPEQHWTTDYITAVRGLTQEIPGAHRLYSIVLSTNLAELQRIGIAKEPQARGESDGEIKIEPTPFDQSKCLTRFRPKGQQKQLEAYQAAENSQSLEELIAQLSQLKKGA